MVDRLSNLIGIFEKPGFDFSDNRAEHDDIFGDAYGYTLPAAFVAKVCVR